MVYPERHVSHPHRRRLAVRQRTPPHRARRRVRRPLRRFRPLPAHGGQRGADGLRHRRARHAAAGPGGEGGRHRPGARRPVQPPDRRGPCRSGPELRPVHPHHHPQPLRGGAGAVPRTARQRLHGAADDDGRDFPVDGPHAARPLHRGHLPDLRRVRRPRRPVRQLRQPARPGRPHRPGEQDQRRDPEVRRDRAFPPRPARHRRRPGGVAEGPRGLAPQRAEVLAEPARGHPPARHDPRHRLGRAHPAGRLVGQQRQEALRLVRRGRRLSVGVHRVGVPRRPPRRVARFLERRRRRRRCRRGVLLLHGQGQHHVPLADLAGGAAGLRGQGLAWRRGRRARRSGPAHRGRLVGVPDHVGLEVLLVEGRGHLRQGLPRGVRPGPAALLHRGRRPGEPGHRLHVGRVRPPREQRAGQRLGQPGQPHRVHGAQEFRRGPRARGFA